MLGILQDFTMSSQSGRIDPGVTAASIAAAKASALDELRAAAAAVAFSHGHVLGTWYELHDDGSEVAYCRPCRRRAVIDILRDPHLAGDALREPCRRPDAFLVNQHDSVTRGGSR